MTPYGRMHRACGRLRSFGRVSEPSETAALFFCTHGAAGAASQEQRIAAPCTASKRKQSIHIATDAGT